MVILHDSEVEITAQKEVVKSSLNWIVAAFATEFSVYVKNLKKSFKTVMFNVSAATGQM